MNYSPEPIGVGKYSGELAAWLARQGYVVAVVAAQPHYPGFAPRAPRPWRYSRSVEAGVSVTRCPLLLRNGGRGIWRLIAPLSYGFTALPALIGAALRFRPDVVLAVEPTLFAAPASILAARLVGAPVALHRQDGEVEAAFATGHVTGSRLNAVARWCESVLLRRFDAVSAVSDGMAARLRTVASAPVTVLRNWIWMAAPPTSGQIAAMRQRLGIGAQEKLLLYAGHLGPKQDLPTLLAALRIASRESAGLRIVIAGEGPLAGAVAAACAELPNLTVLPLQPAEDLPVLLAAADLHVLPQDARAAGCVFPSKLGPMLATGRPVVVTADAGSDLALWLGDAASLAPAGDPAAFAAAIVSALDADPAARATEALALARTLDAAAVLPAFAAHLEALAAAGWRRSVDRGAVSAEPAPVSGFDGRA